MSDPTQPLAGDHHSPDEILAHPRFAAARAAFVEAVLDLYEGDAFLNRLLLEALKTWRFTPATDAGKPVASTFDIRVRFAVE